MELDCKFHTSIYPATFVVMRVFNSGRQAPGALLQKEQSNKRQKIEPESKQRNLKESFSPCPESSATYDLNLRDPRATPGPVLSGAPLHKLCFLSKENVKYNRLINLHLLTPHVTNLIHFLDIVNREISRVIQVAYH